MTGKSREPGGSAQPGGRAPAPGQLALVQAFINTHYDLEVEHGAELLASAASTRTWLRDHGLLAPSGIVRRADVRRVRDLREALRELAGGNGASDRRGPIGAVNDAARGAAVELRFDSGGPQ